MAINVTVRDIVNFPGATPKTITCDIAQVVTVGGSPEGDELWVTSATTTATSSGGGAIQSIFKNILKRGWLRGSSVTGLITIPASYGIRIAIDEALASGLNITLTAGENLLPEDVAADLETLIRNQAKIGAGGAKAGDLSYLNCQVRFTNGRFQIESGTIGDSFTGSGRSSVEVGAPTNGNTDVRSLLGLVVYQDSQTLAGRQLAETTLNVAYTSGNSISVVSTASLSDSNPFLVTDGTNTSYAMVSGTPTLGTVYFITSSGTGTGLSSTYASGSVVRRLHDVDTADPVSAITSVDQLYRFAIDSIVNQIHFG